MSACSAATKLSAQLALLPIDIDIGCTFTFFPLSVCAPFVMALSTGINPTTPDGGSVFALKHAPSLLESAGSLENVWTSFSCAGVLIGRISDDLLVAASFPTLRPIGEAFIDVFRSVILADAATLEQCACPHTRVDLLPMPYLSSPLWPIC